MWVHFMVKYLSSERSVHTYSISSGTTAQENRTHPPCELLPPKKSHLTLEGFVFLPSVNQITKY